MVSAASMASAASVASTASSGKASRELVRKSKERPRVVPNHLTRLVGLSASGSRLRDTAEPHSITRAAAQSILQERSPSSVDRSPSFLDRSPSIFNAKGEPWAYVGNPDERYGVYDVADLSPPLTSVDGAPLVFDEELPDDVCEEIPGDFFAYLMAQEATNTRSPGLRSRSDRTPSNGSMGSSEKLRGLGTAPQTLESALAPTIPSPRRRGTYGPAREYGPTKEVKRTMPLYDKEFRRVMRQVTHNLTTMPRLRSHDF
jgi:hypothetical protein